MQLPVHIAFFTNGDNNEWSFLLYRKHPVVSRKGVQRMGLVRHDEALAAARILGVPVTQLTFLGYPDFGTMPMWKAHWGERPPYRSMLSRVTAVPYANARSPGALYKGEEVLRDLTSVLREVRPTKIFVSHPADHMPDHAALYLFTRVALWDVASEMQPELYPYLTHFKHWPTPRGFHPTEPLEPPKLFKDSVAWCTYPLRPEMVERKQQAIKAHHTQYTYSATYLRSFLRADELFGDFPLVPLRTNAPAVPLASKANEVSTEPPEELSDVERAAFVGLETRFVQREGEQIVLTVEFSHPLGKAVEASVYLFGYRADRPFAHMPKLRVSVGAVGYAVYDQGHVLPDKLVWVSHTAKQLIIRVPLDVLGRPEKIFTSGRTYLGEIPLDWGPWRVLELGGDP